MISWGGGHKGVLGGISLTKLSVHKNIAYSVVFEIDVKIRNFGTLITSCQDAGIYEAAIGRQIYIWNSLPIRFIRVLARWLLQNYYRTFSGFQVF